MLFPSFVRNVQLRILICAYRAIALVLNFSVYIFCCSNYRKTFHLNDYPQKYELLAWV